jgi:mannan endo-1,4-beta-mannosidase
MRPSRGTERVRPRVSLFMAFALAAVAVSFTGVRFTLRPPPHPPVQASLPAAPASYLGVFEPGSPPSYQPIAEFARAVGREPNLIGYYSGWAQPFSLSFVQTMRSHGIIPFVQIDPTLASVSGIATGIYDDYLIAYADSVRDFGHQVVIGFGHEMNAPTYSWGYGRTPASTFVAAWQHIVNVFRGQGAGNVTWLWTLQADRPGTGPIQTWWPGTGYVDWVGIDGYYYRPSDTFASVFGTTIDQVRAFTHKPVLLSETAVGNQADQYFNILNLFAGMAQYKTLGLVWFDKDQQVQGGGVYKQDWRIEGNAQAEVAFRLGISSLTLVPTRPAHR